MLSSNILAVLAVAVPLVAGNLEMPEMPETPDLLVLALQHWGLISRAVLAVVVEAAAQQVTLGLRAILELDGYGIAVVFFAALIPAVLAVLEPAGVVRVLLPPVMPGVEEVVALAFLMPGLQAAVLPGGQEAPRVAVLGVLLLIFVMGFPEVIHAQL